MYKKKKTCISVVTAKEPKMNLTREWSTANWPILWTKRDTPTDNFKWGFSLSRVQVTPRNLIFLLIFLSISSNWLILILYYVTLTELEPVYNVQFVTLVTNPQWLLEKSDWVLTEICEQAEHQSQSFTLGQKSAVSVEEVKIEEVVILEGPPPPSADKSSAESNTGKKALVGTCSYLRLVLISFKTNCHPQNCGQIFPHHATDNYCYCNSYY